MMKAKMAHQLVGLTNKLLFQVFLDVCKSYLSLDKER